jgi:hypothetical protein
MRLSKVYVEEILDCLWCFWRSAGEQMLDMMKGRYDL